MLMMICTNRGSVKPVTFRTIYSELSATSIFQPAIYPLGILRAVGTNHTVPVKFSRANWIGDGPVSFAVSQKVDVSYR